MEAMKRIIVNSKPHDIAIIPIHLKTGQREHRHYCAYVILEEWKRKPDDEPPNLSEPESILSCCTYYEKGVYGIDTAHHFNERMTAKEKFEDAIRQITGLIKDYDRRTKE